MARHKPSYLSDLWAGKQKYPILCKNLNHLLINSNNNKKTYTNKKKTTKTKKQTEKNTHTQKKKKTGNMLTFSRWSYDSIVKKIIRTLRTTTMITKKLETRYKNKSRKKYHKLKTNENNKTDIHTHNQYYQYE